MSGVVGRIRSKFVEHSRKLYSTIPSGRSDISNDCNFQHPLILSCSFRLQMEATIKLPVMQVHNLSSSQFPVLKPLRNFPCKYVMGSQTGIGDKASYLKKSSHLTSTKLFHRYQGTTSTVARGKIHTKVKSAIADSPPRDTLEPPSVATVQDLEDTWKVKMLYDGECPLCMIEVNTLRERNKTYGAIKFVDIAASDYSPEENAGVEFETAMGKIHCIERDGNIVTGVEAFQKFYDVLDMGWVYAITKVKPVFAVAEAVYEFWAKYRLPITGRPSLAVVLEERRKLQEEGTCDLNGRCRVD